MTSVPESPFRYGLNTSTIAGQKLGLLDQIDIAAAAAYDGIEIWMRTIDEHLAAGSTLDDVRTRAADLGVTIENAIGFQPWVVDDEAERRRGLDSLACEMEQLAKIGCRRIAAPPIAATDSRIDPRLVAERFATVLELGRDAGVTPQLELWGFSATLGSLDDLMGAADQVIGAGIGGAPSIRLLLDAYHLHRGGSDHRAIAAIDPSWIEVFHLNDFPTDVPLPELTDADRVYPGDGSGPIVEILGLLAASDAEVLLSLELFNRDLWRQPAEQVARTGLAKMQACVDAALGDSGFDNPG